VELAGRQVNASSKSGHLDSESLESIRRNWDARARENPRAYINWPEVSDNDTAFFESGRVDYNRFVTPFLVRMNFDPRNKTALEIGCGIGRIARWMAADFGSYIGVDVSPEMIRKASSYAIPRARFQAVSGGDLTGIEDASVDFVLSFAVFQHVPEKRAILNYFSEAARVLRTGGIFRLHMKGVWTHRLGTMALEAGLSRPLVAGFRLPFLRVRRLDTWQGVSIPPAEAVRECTARGLKVEDVEGEWTVMMWLGGHR
jgi:SAM-dependent methyltransferase